MRPIQLKLKNIGPFLEETVDFEKLDNMFIITGKTGAGKTFIFDAMTFALYGVLSGNRAGLEKDLRSRYSSEEDDCYVEFTFDIGNERFRVKRTVNPHTVFVEKFVNQSFESLYDKKDKKVKEKNEFLQSLIGLTSAEFSKVILLPQGAFSEFLKQNSSERKETLKKLFPVQDYSKLIDLAQEKARNYDNEIKKIDAVIDGEYKSFSDSSITFENAEEKLASMEKEIQGFQNQEEAYTKQLSNLEVQKNNISRDLEDAKTNEANKEKLTDLKKQEQEMKVLEKELNRSEKANALSMFLESKKTAVKNLEQNEINKTEKNKNLTQVTETRDSLIKSEDEMNSLKEELSKMKTSIDSLDEKIKKIPTYVELEKKVSESLNNKEEALREKTDIEKQIVKLTEELHGEKIEECISEVQKNLLNLQDKKNKLENEKNNCEERDKLKTEGDALLKEKNSLSQTVTDAGNLVLKTQNTLNAKKAEAENFRVKHTAFSLVNVLKPGCPCPVCGSFEHPNPAVIPEGLLNPEEEIPVYEDALLKAQEKLAGIQKELSVVEARITHITNNLEKYKDLGETKNVSEEYGKVEADYEQADKELSKLQGLQKKLSDLNSDMASKEKAYTEAENKYIEINTNYKNIKADLGQNPKELQSEYDSLKGEYDQKTLEYVNWKDSLEKANNDYAAALSALKEVEKALENAKSAKSAAEKVLQEKIDVSEFTTEKELEENLMDLEILNEKRQDLNAFKEDLRSITDAVKNARKVKPIKELEEAKTVCEVETDTILNKSRENHQKLETEKAKKLTFENSYKKVQENAQKKAELEKEALPYKKIAKNLGGFNPANVPFDVWALGMYFEQVVEFASQRFFEISGHRFEFVLRDLGDKEGGGKKGLELQILDHNTPNAKVSDPSDLSGGETFEASISLALALTDVVQNNSGGIVLDSLFIDEGFGTLDDELLDKTMEILSDLSESKMIGFISHVESLQNSESGINSQINVIKSNSGSHIEII